ncbi:hypothetical protein WJX74_006482 [Apatococcus lobatus]|uniref:RING-type domain-containing protein n=2 Tax=Apatococcus TaxID=904362 RepID=A0AAW1SRW9_9CHLO
MKCNSCWSELGQQRAAATTCGHLFCLDCARNILSDGSSGTCTICETLLTQSNFRAITVDQEASTCKLALVGQTPETTLNSALASISFFLQQRELVHNRQEAQWKRKVSKVEAAAKKKLQEIHNAYNEAKRRYDEVLQAKTTLEKDNEELHHKFKQKAMQHRRIQELNQRLQAEQEMMQRQPRSLPPYPSNLSPADKRIALPSLGPGRTVRTVHHERQVFPQGDEFRLSPEPTGQKFKKRKSMPGGQGLPRSFGDAPGADALSPVLRQGFAYGQQPVHTNPLQDTLQPAIQSTFGLPEFRQGLSGMSI